MDKVALFAAFLLPLLGHAADSVDAPPRQASGPLGREARKPFSQDCFEEAKSIVVAASRRGPALPRVDAETNLALRKTGISLGTLGFTSLITPPSEYSLVQLRTADRPTDDGACPLHEMYLGFREGGFIPQPERFFGPLRAGSK